MRKNLGEGGKRKKKKENGKKAFVKWEEGLKGGEGIVRLEMYHVQAPPPTGECAQWVPKMYQ